jgi:hypothetical protein
MDLYQVTFAVLVIGSCWLAWTHHKRELRTISAAREEGLESQAFENHGDPKKFRRTFIPVYLLIMGSDWLQVSLYVKHIHTTMFNDIYREHMSTLFTRTKRTLPNR